MLLAFSRLHGLEADHVAVAALKLMAGCRGVKPGDATTPRPPCRRQKQHGGAGGGHDGGSVLLRLRLRWFLGGSCC